MERNVSELIGKVITKIDNDYSELIFHCESGEVYKLYHYPECCESVLIDDINGDLNDLIGSPILVAEEITNYEPTSQSDKDKTKEVEEYGSCTWTFYKFATSKGYVDVKWFGESNGFYSESVDFILLGVDYEG